MLTISLSFVFFFTDTATTEIYTLSLHDALPILMAPPAAPAAAPAESKKKDEKPAEDEKKKEEEALAGLGARPLLDRKSTRLNSSHRCISYAVFCLKKKKKKQTICRSNKNKPQQR